MQTNDAELTTWLTDLRRAHEYLDQGKPFFSGKDCAELADLVERLEDEASKYRWLLANIGKWECVPSCVSFKNLNGLEFNPKCTFSAFDVGYVGFMFPEALKLAMQASTLREAKKSC